MCHANLEVHAKHNLIWLILLVLKYSIYYIICFGLLFLKVEIIQWTNNRKLYENRQYALIRNKCFVLYAGFNLACKVS